MRWTQLCATYEETLRAGASAADPATPLFTPGTPLGESRWKDLKVRVVEHVSISSQPEHTIYSLELEGNSML